MEFKEYTGKTVDDALANALVEMGTTSDMVEYEVVEKGSNGFLGLGTKEAVVRVALKEEVAEVISNTDPTEIAKSFLNDVFDVMKLEVTIDTKFDDIDNVLDIELSGPEMGVIIGKRGQTLDSLQYLTNLAVNRKLENYTKVKIDTEDYRRRRKETLENLAKNCAYKVKKTRRPVPLEAMNPYERRIIHSALQNDQYVTTHSEGEEPYRHVVITLKK